MSVTTAPAGFSGRWRQYDAPRRPGHIAPVNELITTRPVVWAECHDVADVQSAVRTASAHGMRVAVRGGGQHVAGYSHAADAIVVDLSRMRAARYESLTEQLVVQGGVLGGDLVRAGQGAGHATVTGIMSITGLGLILNGGVGYLSPSLGFASDCITAAEVVTASGELIELRPESDPDAFWALRGCGPALGVVTSLHLRTTPIPRVVVGGSVAWRGEAAARAVLAHVDDADLPAGLYPIFSLGLGEVDAAGRREPVLRATLADSSGALTVDEILGWFAVPPDEHGLAEMGWVELHHLFDEWAFPARQAVDEETILSLNDEVITEALGSVSALQATGFDDRSYIEIYPHRGAMTAVPALGSVIDARRRQWSVAALAFWSDSEQDERHIGWAENLRSRMSATAGATGRCFPNNVSVFGESPMSRLYGPDVSRLRAVSERLDPGRVFSHHPFACCQQLDENR